MTTASVTPIWGPGENNKTGSQLTRDRKKLYLEWLLTPTEERDPPTKKAFAELLGVSGQTLRNYSQDPQFQSKLATRQAEVNKVERASDVLDALYLRATKTAQTDAAANSAAKIWLDYVSKVTDNGDNQINVEELTNEDLGDLLGKLLKTFSASS